MRRMVSTKSACCLRRLMVLDMGHSGGARRLGAANVERRSGQIAAVVTRKACESIKSSLESSPPALARTKLVLSFLALDRKSTRLNSSHPSISYAVFCLKKKKKKI